MGTLTSFQDRDTDVDKEIPCLIFIDYDSSKTPISYPKKDVTVFIRDSYTSKT